MTGLVSIIFITLLEGLSLSDSPLYADIQSFLNASTSNPALLDFEGMFAILKQMVNQRYIAFEARQPLS